MSDNFRALAEGTGLVETPDGALLYCQVRGQGAPILFLHGWTVSGRFWQSQVEGLAGRFKVAVMDLRAHGNSSKVAQGHTLPQYARDVRTVLEALDLRDAALVGWSMAGPLVLEYFKQFGADRLKALGLVDMTPYPFSPGEWNGHKLKNYNVEGMNDMLISFFSDRRAAGEAFIHTMHHGGRAPAENLDWMLREHLKTPTVAAAAVYSDYLMRDYTDVLGSISLPTLVVTGQGQTFTESQAMGRWLADQIPGSTLAAFPESGHQPFYEEADRFNRVLADFLERC